MSVQDTIKAELIAAEVVAEVERQRSLSIGGDTAVFDASNSKNDWVAYIAAYAGRAADKCVRNEREEQDFRVNLLKTAALCVSAIAAVDAGHC